MEIPLIIVIIPVYNVEKYFRACLDSVLAQTLADFELFLIDDGSPDGSGGICDEYEQRDPRVRVFHQKRFFLNYPLSCKTTLISRLTACGCLFRTLFA